MRRSPLTSLKAILRSAAEALGVQRAAHQALIAEMWPQIVGAETTPHTHPAELRGATLIVEVDPGLWVQEVSARRGRFVDEINRRLGERVVSEIRIRPRPATRGQLRTSAIVPSAGDSPELSEQEVAAIDRTVGEIADADLREATRRAMVSQVKWRKRVRPAGR